MNKLTILLFVAFAFPQLSAAQDSIMDELKYEVNIVYPYISITKEKLNEAHTLIDLNANYKSSWVKKYLSVEVLTCYQGKERKAVSKNNTLSQEQKNNIKMADMGTDVSVRVQYMPDNTLTHNNIKEMNFSFSVTPENEAKYIGGQQQLKKYLKDSAIDKIPNGSFKGYDLAAIKFTINEDGKVIDAHIFQPMLRSSSKDKKTDELLLETISNMPSWKPAEYVNGLKTKQTFVLTVGNMENCLVHLLNID